MVPEAYKQLYPFPYINRIIQIINGFHSYSQRAVGVQMYISHLKFYFFLKYILKRTLPSLLFLQDAFQSLIQGIPLSGLSEIQK